MPTPPRATHSVKLGVSSLRQQLVADVEVLLKQHHARLAQHVDENMEELYERFSRHLSKVLTHSDHSREPGSPLPSLNLSPVQRDHSSTGTGESVREVKANIRSFSDSMVIKKQTARNQQHPVHDDEPMMMGYSKSIKTHGSSIWSVAFRSYIVRSPKFEALMCLLIVANTITLGLEASFMARQERPPVFGGLTTFFTAVFTLELLFRFSAEPRDFFVSNQWMWNTTDSAVVIMSLIELGIQVVNPTAGLNLTYIRVIRIVRTVRIFRIVRALQVFSSLRILVYCVFNTMRSLFWTIALLTVILYIFGIIFTQAAADYVRQTSEGSIGGLSAEEELLYDGLRKYYSSLSMAMFTLFKAVTGGVSWQEVSSPLGLVSPFWEGIFTCYITFTYFAVLNVVTGVFCQGAIDGAAHDKDMVIQSQMANKKVYVDQVKELFRCIDAKNTGSVNYVMLEKCLEEERCQAYFDALGITSDDAWNLFALLDCDGSNMIDEEEFIDGCMRLRGSARSLDSHLLLYESHWTMNKVAILLKSFNDLVDQICAMIPENNELKRASVDVEEDAAAGIPNVKFRGPSFAHSSSSQLFEAKTLPGSTEPGMQAALSMNRMSVFSTKAFAHDALPTQEGSSGESTTDSPDSQRSKGTELEQSDDTAASSTTPTKKSVRKTVSLDPKVSVKMIHEEDGQVALRPQVTLELI